jgi:FkbM family methyltransferase
MTTAELLSETVESARGRETAAIAGLEEQATGRLVLYGAGRLGRKTAAALRRSGVTPLAFADSDPGLQGTIVDGIRVTSPAAAADRWRDEALFVVTTFRPDQGGVAARLDELAAQGCRRTADFLRLAWKYEGILPHFAAELPSRLLGHAGELSRAASLWSDDISRETFRQGIAWRLRAEFHRASDPAPDQYFPRDILRPYPDESFVDGGAFDGDTVRRAPWPFARILAVEPDPSSAARLRSVGGRNLEVHEALLGSAPGSARFSGTGTMESRRSDSGVLEVPVTTIDQLASGERPTFIKLDVEGDELEALQGARETLERTQPVVAACLYHRPEDLWTIPLFLQQILPAHRMYLRAHAWDGFELVAYAVPADRCLHPP